MKKVTQLTVLFFAFLLNAKAQVNNLIFNGGNGDGWAQNSFSQAGTNIFAGHYGSGWHTANYAQIADNIFSGGSSDGWASAIYLQTGNNIFVGGQADGWSTAFYSQATLPVKMEYFKVMKKEERFSFLEWKTSSEINASHFIIESSTNGLNFSVIGNVKAIGTGDNRYSFTDNATYAGTKVYYRLKMLDIDGQFTYSNIVVINFSANQVVSVFPNPAATIVNIHIGNNSLLNTTAILYNMQGQAIQNIVLKNNLQKMNMQNLASGIYMLRFSDGTSFKIIKE